MGVVLMPGKDMHLVALQDGQGIEILAVDERGAVADFPVMGIYRHEDRLEVGHWPDGEEWAGLGFVTILSEVKADE